MPQWRKERMLHNIMCVDHHNHSSIRDTMLFKHICNTASYNDGEIREVKYCATAVSAQSLHGLPFRRPAYSLAQLIYSGCLPV